MKNKYNISGNIQKLMQEVGNPKRPPKGWDGVMEYDWQHFNGLLDAVFEDMKGMALKHNIALDEAWFKNHVEYLAISVVDYYEQVQFLKELVRLGVVLRTSCEWGIKGYRVSYTKYSKYVREGMLAGLVKELEDFEREQREKNIFVDGILTDKIRKHLQGEEVYYPHGFLPDGKPYYKDTEDYLLYSVDFSYLEHGRCEAAQSLAYCVLGKDHKKGWNLSVKEGALIYDLLHYCGYIRPEQKEDKEFEIYPEKHKYDMVKEYFGVGGKSNKK